MHPTTIRLTINLEDHIYKEGFPRINFAELIEPPSIPTPPTDSNAGGETFPTTKDEEVKEKKKKSRQPNLQAGKTYKGIREQDFYEVAHGYDTDDPFVDDSEAYEDFAPAETKLLHGSFYVNKGKVEFSHVPFENPEGSLIYDDTPPPKTKSTKSVNNDTSKEAEPGSPFGMKRSSSFVGNEAYMITPPKKSNKKRKDSIKFSPKMVLKRTKSFKGQQTESIGLPTSDNPITPSLIDKSITPDKPLSPPTKSLDHPLLTEKNVSKNLFPAQTKPVESEKPQKQATKTLHQTTTQPVPSKKTEKTSPVIPPEPVIDMNAILLEKLIEANVLEQMDLNIDCFTPGFYEKNNIHTFSSQIPDSLANIIQQFFNHIQSIMKNPTNMNSKDNRFGRCLILGKIHAFMKRKQDLNLTESIQNFLAPFFLNKFHSLTVILETVLTIIQNSFLSTPLQALIAQIQPHIDRIHDSNSNEGSQDEKQTGAKKRFKWSFDLKKLLGNAVAAQIEIEKNGFGVCPEKLTNEQIIIQFLTTCVLPCWPKGRMKASKLFKVTLPYHQDFTGPQPPSSESTPPMVIVTCSPSLSPSNKIVNWKLHYSTGGPGSTEQYTKGTTLGGAQPKKSESPHTETNIHKSAPAKLISPSNKMTSPKSKVAHTNQLNRELIPVTSLIPLASLQAKKSPLIKKSVEMTKTHEKTPDLRIPQPEIEGNINLNKSPIPLNKSPIRMNKSPIPSFPSDVDMKPLLPTSFNTPTHFNPKQFEMLQNYRPNLLLPPGSIFANNFANPLTQTSEAALLNSSLNLINSANLGQNIFIQHPTYPETIIHLKQGETSPNSHSQKSHSQP